MINQNTKQAIISELNKQIPHVGSANKLSAQLQVSNATISNMVNGAHAAISDSMWLKVQRALGIKAEDQWMHADTVPYLKLSGFFNDARLHANMFALVTKPGGGKTYTLDTYRNKYQNVFYVKCERHTTERDFLSDLLISMGKNMPIKRITLMLKEVVKELRRLESPLIIIDEIEKVSNGVIMLMIDLYNALQDKCGIVLIGTPYLKDRIESGVARGKLGYNELNSRIGGKIIVIPAPKHNDAALVLRANGISEPTVIEKIITDSDDLNNDVDLRRVSRLVHAQQQRGAA